MVLIRLSFSSFIMGVSIVSMYHLHEIFCKIFISCDILVISLLQYIFLRIQTIVGYPPLFWCAYFMPRLHLHKEMTAPISSCLVCQLLPKVVGSIVDYYHHQSIVDN